ncbi:hypothetical protein HNP38_001321 [Chryseobacterium defluvii]|uniref:Uncharacterized protein n=1 Tax=Chryseobacterium defluvii TaxID=160396 RepID=A0A840K9M9_9FLAO|nr:hypothetical protein [Chryseobacterium defluvii]
MKKSNQLLENFQVEELEKRYEMGGWQLEIDELPK